MKVEVYSKGEVQSMPEDYFIDKKFISINNTFENFIPEVNVAEKLLLLFNDLDDCQLSSWEYFVFEYSEPVGRMVEKMLKQKNSYYGIPFLPSQAKKIIDFLDSNDKDVVIHCEYGRSRSHSVALFLESHMDYKYTRRPQKGKINERVLRLLEKTLMKK